MNNLEKPNNNDFTLESEILDEYLNQGQECEITLKFADKLGGIFAELALDYPDIQLSSLLH